MSGLDEVRGMTLRGYLRVIWMRLWLVALVVVVCAGTAFLYSNSKTRLYEASARLMYQPPTNISDPTASRTSINTDTMGIQLQSVTSTVNSPGVKTQARQALDPAVTKLAYVVEAAVVTPESNSTTTAFPNSVDITATTTSPEAAAVIANAYAAAVIALRKADTQQRYQAAQQVVMDQLKLYTTPQAKLTPDYALLTQQLQNLRVAEATATGDFTVILPATAPDAPSSPKPLQAAALGIGLGLIVGVAIAFASSRLDTRVHTHRQIADLLGMPVIGRVPRIQSQRLRTDELLALSEPEGQVSEALRMLRSSLEWASIDGRLRCLLFSSCVKGEGKTVTVCNLAVTLARAGKQVILVDGDLRAPRVHTVLSLPNAVGLTAVALGRLDLEEALQDFRPRLAAVRGRDAAVLVRSARTPPASETEEGGLRVLTSGVLPPEPGEFVASKRLATTLEEIVELEADYVLVDAPPILSVGDAAALSRSADGLILIANIDKVRRPILTSAREVLDAWPSRKIGVVVVGERTQNREYYGYTKSK